MHIVKVELIGDDLDILTVASLHLTNDWTIINEGGSHFLVSEILNSIEVAGEIKSKAEQLLDVLNGIANVIHLNHKAVRTGKVLQLNSRGTYDITIFPGTFHNRSRGFEVTIVLNGVPQKTYSQQIMEVSETDAYVRDVLHFFGQNTWWNLYKIFELIRGDIGSKRIVSYITKKQLSRFTQTAQSRDALGDLARHADPDYMPPSDPMHLDEASILIRQLFRKWLEDKIRTT